MSKATPQTIEQISQFNNNLLIAFRRMILGLNVELSEQGKSRIKLVAEGEVFYIKSIHEDETLTLVTRSQVQFDNIKLSDIILE